MEIEDNQLENENEVAKQVQVKRSDWIAISNLSIGNDNRAIRKPKINELARIFARKGCRTQEHPLSVMPNPNDDSKFIILNGQHRFLACEKQKIEEVYCNIYESLTEEQMDFLRSNPKEIGSKDTYIEVSAKFGKWFLKSIMNCPDDQEYKRPKPDERCKNLELYLNDPNPTEKRSNNWTSLYEYLVVPWATEKFKDAFKKKSLLTTAHLKLLMTKWISLIAHRSFGKFTLRKNGRPIPLKNFEFFPKGLAIIPLNDQLDFIEKALEGIQSSQQKTFQSAGGNFITHFVHFHSNWCRIAPDLASLLKSDGLLAQDFKDYKSMSYWELEFYKKLKEILSKDKLESWVLYADGKKSESSTLLRGNNLDKAVANLFELVKTTLCAPLLTSGHEKMIEYSANGKTLTLSFKNSDFFSYSAQVETEAKDSSKAHLVLVDPPLLDIKEDGFDTAQFCLGSSYEKCPENISKDQLLKIIAEKSTSAAIKCCKKNGYILIWGNIELIYYAKKFLASQTALTLAYREIVVLKEPSGNLNRLHDFLPISVTEHALLVQLGKPTWVYWNSADTNKEGKELENVFCGKKKKNQVLVKGNHPHVKSPYFLNEIFMCFVPRGGLVIDGFAGSCASLYAAVNRGCSLVCVEKEAGGVNQNMRNFIRICKDISGKLAELKVKLAEKKAGLDKYLKEEAFFGCVGMELASVPELHSGQFNNEGENINNNKRKRSLSADDQELQRKEDGEISTADTLGQLDDKAVPQSQEHEIPSDTTGEILDIISNFDHADSISEDLGAGIDIPRLQAFSEYDPQLKFPEDNTFDPGKDISFGLAEESESTLANISALSDFGLVENDQTASSRISQPKAAPSTQAQVTIPIQSKAKEDALNQKKIASKSISKTGLFPVKLFQPASICESKSKSPKENVLEPKAKIVLTGDLSKLASKAKIRKRFK